MPLHPVIIITKDNMFIDYQDIDKIMNNYELCAPICGYDINMVKFNSNVIIVPNNDDDDDITMGVKFYSDNNLEYHNTIASEIYKGNMYGDVIIVPNNDDDDIETLLNHFKIYM